MTEKLFAQALLPVLEYLDLAIADMNGELFAIKSIR